MFDMDGVLFDSMPSHAAAWEKAMRLHGLKLTREDVYMNEGRTGDGTVDLFTLSSWGRRATKAEVEEIYSTKSRIFNAMPEVKPMKGVHLVLQEVTDQGLLPVIVTGSGQRSLLDRLDKEFPGVFSEERMVTAFDVTHGKPSPEPYLKGLEKADAFLHKNHDRQSEGEKTGTHLSAEEALVIENAPLGVQAAKAAGIRVIAVNTGPLPDSVLRDSGADLVLPDMAALLDWFKNRTR